MVRRKEKEKKTGVVLLVVVSLLALFVLIGVTYVLATDSLQPPATPQIDVHNKATQQGEQQP